MVAFGSRHGRVRPLFPHSNLGCEPIIEWAKATGLLGFDPEQEAADKMTLLNMQALSKDLHDMMDAGDAAIARVEEAVVQMGLSLESYLAGKLKSGKPWKFDTASQDKATSCKKRKKVGKEDFSAHMCAFISLSRHQFQEPIHVDGLLGEGASHTRAHRRRSPNAYASPPACQARPSSPRHTLLVTHFLLFAAYPPHSSSRSLPLPLPIRSSVLLSGKMHGMRARRENNPTLMACLKKKSRDHPPKGKRTEMGGRRAFADLGLCTALERHGHRAPPGHPQHDDDLQRFGKNLRQGNKNAEKARICLTTFLGDLIEYAHLALVL